MKNPDNIAGIEVGAFPLIVFVHVPKTAGSTVKTFLTRCTPRGHSYVERVVSNEAEFLSLARNSDWIGGHLPRHILATHLIWCERSLEYYTVVREPVAHLVSQLNFSFTRHHRANYYNQHDLTEQHIDALVMSTDMSKPSAVMALLLRYAGHFLNMQSRLVLGADFADISIDEISRRLASYTYVANETNLPNLYRAFGFAQNPEGANEIRENVAPRFIDGKIFDSPQLRDFLDHHHKHDLRLYAMARHFSWPAERRLPFRPALLGIDVFSSENFNEQTYLDSNPDVAAWVDSGKLTSGRTHFDATGYAEGRMRRRWVFPSATGFKPDTTVDNVSAPAAIERVHKLRTDLARMAAELQSRQQVSTSQ